MQLKKILEGLNVLKYTGVSDIEIKGIAYNSKKVEKGFLFVCIEGTVSDGHDYIPQALENGAAALIVQRESSVIAGVPAAVVEDSRAALAFAADRFYGHPSSKFNLIGITGTKGKTTTTYMIKAAMEAADMKVGLVGTLGTKIGNREIHSDRTTPESSDLQSIFAEMAQEKVDSAVIEVSSQGLNLHRVSFCDFKIGVFTNFSKDHIGPREHSTMEDYLNAKLKLFNLVQKGLVNADSPYASRVIENAPGKILTYGIDSDADIRAKALVLKPRAVEFEVEAPWFTGRVRVNIPGKFSVYNALAAIGVCGMSGMSLEAISQGLENVQVPGRAELVPVETDYAVMIDYAHTPDSLENILTTVKDYTKGRVICVFGCGGDRDKTKRPIMGKIAGEIADYSVITSDNPRTEVPETIISEIEEGIKLTNGKYICITERYKAIEHALREGKSGDTIVLAGKGHETYQILPDKTIHFDEREVVREILDRMRE